MSLRRAMCYLLYVCMADIPEYMQIPIYVWHTRHCNTQCQHTVYPKKYAHGFCFAVLCCGYTLTDFPISIRLTSLALWQSNDCLSASKATLMNMDKYVMWIHYERLQDHNKAKHNKTVCIFLGIYCMYVREMGVARRYRYIKSPLYILTWYPLGTVVVHHGGPYQWHLATRILMSGWGPMRHPRLNHCSAAECMGCVMLMDWQ